MKNTFPFLLAGISLTFCINVLSQTELPIVIQPSPEAASLAKFVEIPVSHFNGTPNISIPLYEIVEGDIRIPITLSYHASGIKVSEDASWVGLGWSLSAGGEIIVDQRGKNDFAGTGYCRASVLPVAEGDFTNARIQILQSDLCNFTSEPGSSETFSQELMPNYYDGEPDIYLFNFLNYSGKFLYRRQYLDGHHVNNVEIIDRQKINFIKDGNSFMAETPEGSIYDFSKCELSYNASIYNSTDLYTTSYKLTNIQSPFGKEVTFKYKSSEEAILQSPNISFVEASLQYNSLKRKDAGTISNNYLFGQYLDTISFSNGFVKFKTSSRDDIINGLKLDAIEVYQKQSNGLPVKIKTIRFNYDYFEGDGRYGDFYERGLGFSGLYDPNYSVEKRKLRLRLLSIVIDGEQTYNFAYNEQPLPFKTSMAVDYWGYFNGAQGNNTLLPNGKDLAKFYELPVPFQLYRGANREPNERYMKAGILTSITYPTGGTTHFAFSAHEYNNFADKETTSPKNIGAFDFNVNNGVGAIDKLHSEEFTYDRSSMVEFSIEIVSSDAYDEGECYVAVEKFNNTTGEWTKVPDLTWDILYLIQYEEGQNYYRYGTNVQKTINPGKYRLIAKYPDNDRVVGLRYASIGALVLVKQNVGILKGGGLRIDTIKKVPVNGNEMTVTYSYIEGKNLSIPFFTRFIDEYANIANTALLSEFVGGCYLYSNDYGSMMYSNMLVNYSNSANGSIVGYRNVTESYSGKEGGKTEYVFKIAAENMPFPGNNLPGIPTPNRLDIGLLESKTDYSYDKESDKFYPIRKITNNYGLQDKLLLWGYKSEYEPVVIICPEGTEKTGILGGNCGELRLHFYPIRLARPALLSSTEVLYSKEGQPLSTWNQFEYNSDGFLSRTISKNSKEEQILTETTYPSDYTSDCTEEWINSMKENYMLGVPVETLKKVNGYAAGGSYTKYTAQNGLVLPQEIYQLKAAPFQTIALSLDNTCQQMSSLYYKTGEIEYYDNGNIKSVTKTDNYTTVYLWSYNNSYPIAKIENADYITVEMVLGGLANVSAFGLKLWPTASEIQTYLAPLFTDPQLTKSLVSTYTCKPLVGIVSETDPNGITTYYEYDDFGRLKLVKDTNGDIIKMYEYNYKSH